MQKEFQWVSKDGKRYFHAGFGQQDAVGAPRASEAIPMQEGLRVMLSKGIDVAWKLLLIRMLLPKAHGKKK